MLAVADIGRPRQRDYSVDFLRLREKDFENKKTEPTETIKITPT